MRKSFEVNTASFQPGQCSVCVFACELLQPVAAGWCRRWSPARLRSGRCPDGKTIAAASGEEVWLCDAKDGSTKLTLKAELLVMSVAIPPDGKMLAAGLSDKKSEHGCVKVWDVATGKLIKTLE